MKIQQITADSRQVSPGTLFVACRGGTTDGHKFIPNAVASGASAVLGELEINALDIPYIRVANSRMALAHLAAAFYQHPAHQMTMIGVTGTDGKTTTSNLIYQILLAGGYKAGMISTVNAIIGTNIVDTGFHVTTPDAPDVQRYLATMVEAESTHAVLETTSHGWAQHRVDACEFDLGVLTNITHEHLDHHGTFDNYRAAKARLFESLSETGKKDRGNIRMAVLNHDDSSFDYIKSICRCETISYGMAAGADVRAIDIILNERNITFTTLIPGYMPVFITSDLVGAFNVSNCLAAITASVIGLGIDAQICSEGITALKGVPGRMERIEMGQEFTAIIDFAHTPNALKVALQAARKLAKGRVIAIFGSAGLRDKEKRRLMAEISLESADLTILTAEDPRTEPLDGILEDMAKGAFSRNGIEGRDFWRIPDRGAAIRFGLLKAQPGDVVIACGKGHEQSMCFGTTEYAWDDRIAMRAALAEMLQVEGPPMPFLPTDDD